MEENNLRIEVCEYTNKPVVQERFGEEWVCIHDETRKEELENIKQVKKLLKHGKSISYNRRIRSGR